MEKDNPSLKTAGFLLWIHGWEFPDMKQTCDTNWLVVSATLQTGNGHSWVKSSPSLTSSGISNFIDLVNTQDWRLGEWEIESQELEKEISWAFLKDKRYPNHIIFRAQVNANFLHERHIGWFKLTYSEAWDFVHQLARLLENFPAVSKSKEVNK